ncbi:MAG: hypothetical protein ACPGVB_16460, partial [Chitinophagales bacterium]
MKKVVFFRFYITKRTTLNLITMLQKKDPTQTKSWKNLQAHYDQIKNLNIHDLFIADSKRFDEFSI